MEHRKGTDFRSPLPSTLERYNNSFHQTGLGCWEYGIAGSRDTGWDGSCWSESWAGEPGKRGLAPAGAGGPGRCRSSPCLPPAWLLVQVARVLWWYYFSKLIEFLDTIFFVLRKKTSQITFLHVYHHASMFNIWWCVLNWIPCGQSK